MDYNKNKARKIPNKPNNGSEVPNLPDKRKIVLGSLYILKGLDKQTREKIVKEIMKID